MNEQLTPQEIFDKYKHLGEKTVRVMFPDTINFATSIGLQPDDLYQFGLIGCWKGANTYYKTNQKCTIKGHIIRNIRWTIQRMIAQEGLYHLRWKSKAADETNTVAVMSFDYIPNNQGDENDTFHDLIGLDYNLEGEVVGNVLMQIIERKFSNKPRTIEMLKKRISGMNCKEIGDDYGISKERARQILKKALNELKENELQGVI
jgi:RNA polymerase sigma factor (sigma-70 family)